MVLKMPPTRIGRYLMSSPYSRASAGRLWNARYVHGLEQSKKSSIIFPSTLCSHAVGLPHTRCRLAEQDLLGVVAHAARRSAAPILADRHAALDARPDPHGTKPALHVGELLHVHPLGLVRDDPGERRHVGDGVVAGNP